MWVASTHAFLTIGRPRVKKLWDLNAVSQFERWHEVVRARTKQFDINTYTVAVPFVC